MARKALIQRKKKRPIRFKNTHAVWHAAARIRSTASLNFVGFVYASKLTKVSFLG